MRSSDKERKFKRWLRALNLAKILFADEGYSDKYLEEIEGELRLRRGEGIQLPLPLREEKRKGRK